MAFSDGLQMIGVFGKIEQLGLGLAKCPMMSKI